MANLSMIRSKRHGEEIHSENALVVESFNTFEELQGIGYKNEYQERIAESVDNVINKSPNLLYALEGIGAMYCIPAGHFMRDDDLGTIKVSGDNVIAPGNVSACGNKNAIVRAISAVLDNMGNDIDHKLDHHHKHHCHELFKQQPQFAPDPGKGTVIGRYLDDEDNEILVYNTGMVDCKTCPTTMKKIDELRKQGLIPDYNIALVQGCGDKNPTASYFADMDDITKGVDMGPATTANTTTGEDTVTGESCDPTYDDFGRTNLAHDLDVDSTILEAFSVLNETQNLGYDLLSLQGFDNVRPTNVITESEVIKGRKSRKRVSPDEFEFMRFDNSHIVNAVGWINDWIEDNTKGTNISAIPFDDLYRSREFKKAVDELCEQFDANIVVIYENKPGDMNVYTTMTQERLRQLNDITISKTKGFQFNNNKIEIHIEGANTIRDFAIDRIDLVGQNIVSVLLHEIFHNAMWVWKINDTEFTASLTLSLQLAMSQKSARKRRKIIENFVNHIDNFYGYKLNAVNRRVLVKRLTIATGITTQKPNALKKIKDSFNKAVKKEEASAVNKNEEIKPDKDVEETINMYERYMEKYNKRISSKSVLLRLLFGSLACAGGLVGMAASKDSDSKAGKGIFIGSSVAAIIGGGTTLISLMDALEASIIKAMRKEYKNTKDLEEQWCDMFAAMYKLPVAFKIQTSKNFYTDDKISKDILVKFNAIDIKIHEFIMDPHPSGTERNYQAVKIANQLLEQKELLDPEVVRYLEWLSKAYKQTGENTEIENIYNKSVFDPKEAEDLDKHLEHLANTTNSTLVEFTAYDVLDWNVISE